MDRPVPRGVSCCPETPLSSPPSYKELPGAHSNAQPIISMYTIIIFFISDHVLMNDVDNNLHYKKHMLNLPAILNHKEERVTILAELWFKEKKVDSSDWYRYIMFGNSRDNYKCCDWIVSYLP